MSAFNTIRKRANSAQTPGPPPDPTLQCKLHKRREDSQDRKVRLSRYAVEHVVCLCSEYVAEIFIL